MRRSGGTLYLIALLTAATVLTACTPKGSVEQHTRHYEPPRVSWRVFYL